LSLIFGAAGMQDTVAFVEPAGLRVDEILQRAAGQRRGAVGDLLLIEMIGRAGAVGVKKRVLRSHLDGGADGGDAQLNRIFGWKYGMDFDKAVVRREGFPLDTQTVTGERKIAGDKLAGLLGGKSAVELEGVAGEFDGGFQRKTVRTGDFEAKLSGVALREERKSKQEDGEVEQRTHLSGENLMLTASRDGFKLLRE
jgi:hypothetical protein